MIQRIVSSVLRMPGVVLLGALFLLASGVFAYTRLDVEAYPNPVPPLVETISQPQGWSAEEVERYITIPLEVALSGMPGVTHVRSQSLYGLSDVKCYFDWDTKYADARQEVINRLTLTPLPNGNQATISPWNAIGEVLRYTVEGDGYSVSEKKTVEDWILERQFKRVPGVVDVTSFGGETKQYHVEVDPLKLRGHGVSLQALIGALQNANQNVGGQRLTRGEQSYDVRGIGLIGARGTPLTDIDDVVIAEQKGVPVRVKDVTTRPDGQPGASVGYAPRLGKVGHDDEDDVVQGIVLMRYGGQTKATLEAAHKQIEEIEKNHLLPPGMKIKKYYDRGDLVGVTTHTVIENLLVGMALVSVTLLLFLGNLRAALITAITIPMALLVSFIGLVGTDTSANLISLGAVDFGIVVDANVIMMENIFRHLGSHGRGTMLERVLAAAREVGTPMTFSTLIIGVAFLPLFTLSGVPGAIFAPMARTYAFAIGGGILLALTLTPTLASKALSANTEERENFVMRSIQRVYRPAFDLAMRWPKTAVVLSQTPIVLVLVLAPLLGRDFMPKLEEGNLWIRATLPTSISLEKASAYGTHMRRILRGCPADDNAPCADADRSHPEVVTVVSQLGRPDDGTDVTGFSNVEFFAPLSDFSTWPRGLTKQKLTDQLQAELQKAYPGVVFNFSQYISDNVEEAVAGVKGENSVKIVGPSVEDNEKYAAAVADAMRDIPGITDLGVLESLGQPNIKIVPEREKLERYGLNAGDVNAVVQSAVGGNAVIQVYEGEKLFDLTVRWLPQYRSSVEAIKAITVFTPDGMYVPLGQIATVAEVDGPVTVYRQDGQRYSAVKFGVRGRDLAGAIDEAERKVTAAVLLPYNAHFEWEGEIEELHKIEQRLELVIPLTLLLIAILTYTAVKSWLDTFIVLIAIPVACSGGVLALLVAGEHFSVSAAMGFVSIFGIAIQDSILVVTYFQRMREAGLSIEDAAREAADKRFRPVLMTTLVATLGLTPAALSHGIGSETQKPLAIVVIGGSLLLALLTRVRQAPLLVVAHRAQERLRAWRKPRPEPV